MSDNYVSSSASNKWNISAGACFILSVLSVIALQQGVYSLGLGVYLQNPVYTFILVGQLVAAASFFSKNKIAVIVSAVILMLLYVAHLHFQVVHFQLEGYDFADFYDLIDFLVFMGIPMSLSAIAYLLLAIVTGIGLTKKGGILGILPAMLLFASMLVERDFLRSFYPMLQIAISAFEILALVFAGLWLPSVSKKKKADA
ncbi:MAG: hypothetical protein IJO10_10675 [Clostridia bacterium]|nr:hypothetical protein [Clostridia bacterium]